MKHQIAIIIGSHPGPLPEDQEGEIAKAKRLNAGPEPSLADHLKGMMPGHGAMSHEEKVKKFGAQKGKHKPWSMREKK